MSTYLRDFTILTNVQIVQTGWNIGFVAIHEICMNCINRFLKLIWTISRQHKWLISSHVNPALVPQTTPRNFIQQAVNTWSFYLKEIALLILTSSNPFYLSMHVFSIQHNVHCSWNWIIITLCPSWMWRERVSATKSLCWHCYFHWKVITYVSAISDVASRCRFELNCQTVSVYLCC